MVKQPKIVIDGDTEITLSLKFIIFALGITGIVIGMYFNIVSEIKQIKTSQVYLRNDIMEVKTAVKDLNKLSNQQIATVEDYVIKCLSSNDDIFKFKDTLDVIKQNMITSYWNTWI